MLPIYLLIFSEILAEMISFSKPFVHRFNNVVIKKVFSVYVGGQSLTKKAVAMTLLVLLFP